MKYRRQQNNGLLIVPTCKSYQMPALGLNMANSTSASERNKSRMKKHVHFVIDKLFRQPFWKPARVNIRTSKSGFFIRY
jgi:hypothetical protein